jgi:hypothetical protein
MALSSHLEKHCIHVDNRIDQLDRPALPFSGSFYNFVDNGPDGFRRDLIIIEILDVGLDIPGGHVFGIHGYDFFFQT